MTDVTATDAWQRLAGLHASLVPDLRGWFADDPARAAAYTRTAADLHVDLSKNLITAEVLDALCDLAEHKGYAISVMMDVLSGVRSGSGIMTEVNGPYQAEKRSRCGHMVMALNIEAFGSRAQFDARMEQMVAQIKAVPLAEGFEEVFYPGEIEAQNEERHYRDGLQLPEQTIADLTKVAHDYGVALPPSW